MIPQNDHIDALVIFIALVYVICLVINMSIKKD